jgi:cell division protein YceG involved in septum cleavage
VKYQLQFTYNVFCSNTLAQVATLGICSVLLLLTMIGGILTASVFSVRYSRIETVDKHSRKIIIPEGSLISETFEKKQQSESSSSSSSDED